MKTHRSSIPVLLGLIVLTSLAEPPQATTGPQPLLAGDLGSTEYGTYKIISDRNIFNAGRSARSARSESEEQKPNQAETLTLVGTLSYEKGLYAFFDGSSPDYRKVLETGKLIGGYKIADVSGAHVKLEAGTNTIELTVGMKMRREPDAEWQVMPSEIPPATIRSTSTASESSAESASDSESAIIKKLMQQREQDLK